MSRETRDLLADDDFSFELPQPGAGFLPDEPSRILRPEELNLRPGPGVQVIWLTKGYWTFVSEDVYSELIQHLWCVNVQTSGKIYAVRQGKISDGPMWKKTIYMHRQIAGVLHDPELEVDHENGCGLDNRWENLRVCTHGENMYNIPPREGEVPYRGVRRDRRRKPGKQFVARFAFKLKRFHLGGFPTAEDAARAYDRQVMEVLGHIASRAPQLLRKKLNFPDEWLGIEECPSPSLDEDIPF